MSWIATLLRRTKFSTAQAFWRIPEAKDIGLVMKGSQSLCGRTLSEDHSVRRRSNSSASTVTGRTIPTNCNESATYDQRMEQMQRRNLCRNCGASSHSTEDCTRGPCRQCFKKGHHTSICRQSQQTLKEAKPPRQKPDGKMRKRARDAT